MFTTEELQAIARQYGLSRARSWAIEAAPVADQARVRSLMQQPVDEWGDEHQRLVAAGIALRGGEFVSA